MVPSHSHSSQAPGVEALGDHRLCQDSPKVWDKILTRHRGKENKVETFSLSAGKPSGNTDLGPCTPAGGAGSHSNRPHGSHRALCRRPGASPAVRQRLRVLRLPGGAEGDVPSSSSLKVPEKY